MQSSDARTQQLGAKSLRWADKLEQDVHNREQHHGGRAARPTRTCLREVTMLLESLQQIGLDCIGRLVPWQVYCSSLAGSLQLNHNAA